MVTSENKVILSSGRFSGTSRDQLGKAFEAFKASPQKDRLVLHFHGGLVSLTDAEGIAARMLPIYRDQGLGFPLFVLWESGIWEVLRNNWREIAEQDIFPRLVERVLQFIWGKLDQAPGEKGAAVDLPDRFQVQAKMQEARGGKEPLRERNAEAATLDPDLTPAEEEQFRTLLATDQVLAQAGSRMTKAELTEFSPDLQRDIEASRKAQVPGERGLIESAIWFARACASSAAASSASPTSVTTASTPP
jgi:hypothetical protein